MNIPNSTKIKGLFSALPCNLLIPFGVLILFLWFEAQIPGLPGLNQGIPLWEALGDSSKGQGFNGLFSLRASIDIGLRMIAVLVMFTVARILTKYAPGGCVRFIQTFIKYAQNLKRRSFGLILFLLAFLLPLGFFVLVRGVTPRLGDEIAYLFQARLFSDGQLSIPAPPLSEFFDISLIVNGARWFSQFPPGHPLFLAPPVALGVPWMVGPLMGGVAAVAVWLLGTRLYDERTGRLAGILTLISPFFWYMSGSYLSHSTCLAIGCISALWLMTSIQESGRQSLFAAIGGGAALGVTAMIRPLTAVGLALGLGSLVFMAMPASAGLIRRIRHIAIVLSLFAVCAAAVASLTPLYNQATTGHPMQWGYELAQRSSHELGFGKRGDLDIDYTPARALFNTRVRWRWLDGGFWGLSGGRDPIPGGGFFFWPFPAIALVLATLTRGKPSRTDFALVSVIASLAFPYFFYYYLEICWGPRFLYESSFALLLLTARGSIALGETAKRYGWTNNREGENNRGSFFPSALLIPAVFIAIIHIALPTGETRDGIYDPVTASTRRVDVALSRALEKAEVSEGLVFLEKAGAFYETAWRRMFVDQNKRITFAKDLGEANQNLIGVHGAPYWVATFNNDYMRPEFHIRHVSQTESEETLASRK